MVRFPVPLALALLFLATAGGLRADPAALHAKADEVRLQVVAALEDVAKWAGTVKLNGKRDETWELVLAFDGDHERARATLKYAREGSGAWVQDSRYTRPRNWTPKLLPEWERRRDEALDVWRSGLVGVCREARDGPELGWAADRLLELLTKHPGDPRVLDALREVLLRHLALLGQSEVPADLERVVARLDAQFPDDPVVRAALGEVLVDGRWLLPATARSIQERARLAAAAEAALGGVPDVEKVTLSPEEEAVGLPWAGVLATRHMRVLGTTSEASLREIARSCEAAGSFFEAVFGRPPIRPATYTLYVFPVLAHWKQFAERFPGVADSLRPAAVKATGSGFPLGTTSYACLPVGSEEAERDLCVDVVFQTLLYQTFATWHAATQTFEDLPGWVRIGMSDYLTYRLIGTRILTTVGGEYGRPLEEPQARSPKERAGWLSAARRILEREGAPGTRLMLGKTLGAFQSDDAVTSFAFAAWLLEGMPEKTPAVLEAVGSGQKPAAFATAVLGRTVEGLHVAWSRWLDETATTD